MARPLGFDPEEAQVALMNIFWARGYEGTSMQDIEAATGLKKQSLYRIFGDKHAMYLAALRAYEEQVVAGAEAVLAGATGGARARFAVLFDWIIRSIIETRDLRGCFLANASTEASSADAEIAGALASMNRRLEAAFLTALEADARYREDPALARSRMLHILAAYFGLRIMLKGTFGEEAVRGAAGDLLQTI